MPSVPTWNEVLGYPMPPADITPILLTDITETDLEWARAEIEKRVKEE